MEGIEAALCRTGMIYLSGITLSLFDGYSRDRLFQLLARARNQGVRVVFDTNFRTRSWPDLADARCVYERALRGSDVVLASVEDHALLYGSDEPRDVMDRLRTAGVPETVVKLATPACHIGTAGGGEVVKAAEVRDVVDTTAAGDSFAAGYIAARRAGHDPVVACRAGHTLAGAVVRHRGAIIPKSAMPTILLASEAS